VNLPRRDKRIPPRYQDVPADRIPAARSPDGRVRVRVIAGEALGARAVIETQTPIAYLHVAMEPGAHYEQPMASTFNAFAYVLGGRGTLGRDAAPAERGQLLVFARDGDSIVCAASPSGPFDFIVVGGEPLDEPVARYGPFVMNTPQEIRQAIEDYRAGRMGVIG
jgi:redox-sensitive bicupin YhaK (pirin superfamily)